MDIEQNNEKKKKKNNFFKRTKEKVKYVGQFERKEA